MHILGGQVLPYFAELGDLIQQDTYTAAAKSRLRTLIDRNPRNVSRYLEAGVLFERLGLSDSVIAVYEEGLRVDSTFHQLHRRLGAWYRSTGNTGKAAWHIRIADSLERLSPMPQ